MLALTIIVGVIGIIGMRNAIDSSVFIVEYGYTDSITAAQMRENLSSLEAELYKGLLAVETGNVDMINSVVQQLPEHGADFRALLSTYSTTMFTDDQKDVNPLATLTDAYNSTAASCEDFMFDISSGNANAVRSSFDEITKGLPALGDAYDAILEYNKTATMTNILES